MPLRARRQEVRTIYLGGAHLFGLRCALLCFELVKVVLRLGRCHSIFYAYKTSLLTRDTSPTFALFFVSQNFLIFTIYYYRCKNDIIDVFSDENFIGHE